ncbi:MAG: helix-turn-helix domain-containing protein [Waterburya sp.]
MGRNEKMMCRVSPVNRQVGEEFRMLVHQIMTTASHCLEFESSSAATCAASELLKVASLIVSPRQAGKPNPEGRPKLSRQEIIRRSKDLLEEREGNHVLVGELAAAAGVSERTLRTAFNEYFGVGPIRYLQLRQLHQVYGALRVADPQETSVSDVLMRYGVWDFSRCALRYRQIYGELPSQTLHR